MQLILYSKDRCLVDKRVCPPNIWWTKCVFSWIDPWSLFQAILKYFWWQLWVDIARRAMHVINLSNHISSKTIVLLQYNYDFFKATQWGQFEENRYFLIHVATFWAPFRSLWHPMQLTLYSKDRLLVDKRVCPPNIGWTNGVCSWFRLRKFVKTPTGLSLVAVSKQIKNNMYILGEMLFCLSLSVSWSDCWKPKLGS